MQNTPAFTVDCNNRSDVLVIVDRSSSLGDNDLGVVKDILQQYAQSQQFGQDATKIGLIQFNDVAELIQPFTNDIQVFSQAVGRISQPDGGTNITVAFQLAQSQFAVNRRNDAVPVILLFSDGQDSNGVPHQSFNRLSNSGIFVLGIGIGDASSDLALITDNYYTADDYEDLRANINLLVDQTCSWVNTAEQLSVPPASSPVPTSTSVLVTVTSQEQIPFGLQESMDNYGWLLLLLIALMLLGSLLMFAWGRRKPKGEIDTVRNGEVEYRPITTPNPSSPFDRLNGQSWRRNLQDSNDSPIPQPMVSMLDSLVIGIGTMGLSVLQKLVEYADGANLISHNSISNLKMLHLNFDNNNDTSNYSLIPSSKFDPILNGDTLVPRLRSYEAFRQHFQMLQHKAPFAAKLTQILQRNRKIVIVCEQSQGSVVSEVCALIQALPLQPGYAPKPTVVLLEQGFDLADTGNIENTWDSLATLVETTRMTVGSGTKAFWGDAIPDGQPWINHVVTVVDDADSHNRCSAFVWALLVSPELLSQLEDVITQQDTRFTNYPNSLKFNRIHIDVHHLPTKSLRESYAAHLMMKCLRTDPHSVTRSTQRLALDHQNVEQILNESRSSGYLGQLNRLRETLPRTCQPYLTTLYDELDKRYSKAKRDVESIPRAQVQLVQLTDQATIEVLSSIGFVPQNYPQEGAILAYIVRGGDGIPTQLDDNSMPKFIQLLEQEVHRVAYNLVKANHVSSFNATLANNQGEWDERINSWILDTGIVNPGYHAILPTTLMLGFPGDWQPPDNHISISISDSAFALGIVLHSNITLKELKAIDHLQGNILGYESDRIAYEIFQNDKKDIVDIPFSLYRHLQYRCAIWDLFQVYRVGGLEALNDVLHNQLQLALDATLVDMFITSHRLGILDLGGYLQDQPEPGISPHLINNVTGNSFDSLLMKMFNYFESLLKNPPLLPGFFPPNCP